MARAKPLKAIYRGYIDKIKEQRMNNSFAKKALMGAAAAVFLSVSGGVAANQDGAMDMPDYKNWPTFLDGIEKKSGHVRDIYINKIGAQAKAGEPFANGTVSVMEIYSAKGEMGAMQKGELQKVFVMYKGEGYGKSAQPGMQTGDWVYGAFDAKGNKLSVDYNTCRSCHLPLTTADYVFHYDKYFASK